MQTTHPIFVHDAAARDVYLQPMSDLDSRDRVLKAALTCQPALVSYAHALLADYAAAEDVVQNAFLVVARKHENFAEGTSMLAWCRSIVRLEILSHLRKCRREPTLEDRLLQDAMDAAFVAHQSVEAGPRSDHLRDCLARLTGRARDLIRLRYEENAKYEQIAEALKMGLEAVRKGLFRTKHQLRECVTIRMEQEPNL